MIQKKHSILITNWFYSKINRTAVILDWRTPGESYALVTRDQRSVNESFRALGWRKVCHFKDDNH